MPLEFARLRAPDSQEALLFARRSTAHRTLELLAICLSRPPGNSQTPSAEDEIDWLTRVSSEHAEETVQETVSEIRGELAEVKQLLTELAKKGAV